MTTSNSNSNNNNTNSLILARGLFRRRNDDGFIRRRVADVILKNGASASVGKFKLEPQFVPDRKVVRTILGACSTCCPSRSKIDDLIDEDMKRAGIWNLFDVATSNLQQPFFKQKFSGIYFIWEVAPSSAKQTIKLSQQEILEEAQMKLGPSDDERTRTELKKIAQACVLPFTGIRGWPVIFKLTGWIMRKLSELLWEKVCVHEGELELVKHAHGSDSPIIYLPLNRSDLDPFLLFLTLLSVGLPVPYFFSTKSQRYWGRFVGGIGHHDLPDDIPRRSCDIWKKACFTSILKKRASVCLSLESQRTRSGKPSLELYSIELLSELIEKFESREVEDAWIVPFCVSHEIVPEHLDSGGGSPSFIKCNTGVSVFQKLKNYLFNNLGITRVSFAQPFTFRELKRAFSETGALNNSLEGYMKTFLGSQLCWGSANHSALSASLSSMYDIDLDEFNSSQDNLAFADFLAFHGFFESARAAVPMSTHVVSFILIKKFRHCAISFSELCTEVEKLNSWLRLYEKDVGFSGDVQKVVYRALHLLGPDLIDIRFSKDDINVQTMIRPVLLQDSLAKLGYYANVVVSIFALEAVTATAVFKVAGNSLKVSRGIADTNIRISTAALTMETRSIYSVLMYEFFFHPPCTTFDAAFYHACDRLKDKEILYTVMSEACASRARARCYDSAEDFDSDDDPSSNQALLGKFVPEDYEICNTEGSFATLQLLSSLITPYLEIYASLVIELQCLIPLGNDDCHSKTVRDFELIDILLSAARAKFSVKDYGEYLTYETVKAALATFESHGILVYQVMSNESTVRLEQQFESSKKLRQFADDILRFVTIVTY